MNPEDEASWQRDIGRLRDRLDRHEKQQFESLDALRLELSALESRAGATATTEEPIAPVPAPPEIRAPVPPPIPTIPPPPPPLPEDDTADNSLELQLGRVWLVRLGIVLLLTGLVLLGNFAYKNWIREMPNGVRLAALLALAGVMIESGRRLALKPTLNRFGEVILAGGLAFFYYCTFAAHHVERLRVIESPVLASVFLLVSAGLVAAVSWMRNTRATAVLGILLASYSTMLQPIGWLSCVSSILLAGAGLFLMRRPGWAAPGVAAMVGTYSAFLGWQFLGAAQGDLKNPAVMWFLPPVWAMFSLPGLLDRFRESMSDRARAWFTGGNNAAFFLLFSGLWLNRFQSEHYWAVCGGFGLLLIALGVIGRRTSQIAGSVNLSQGIGLVSLAMILKLDGYHLALGLAGESLLLAGAFAKFRGRSELAFSCLAALGATAMLLTSAAWDHENRIPVWSAGLATMLLAAASVVLCRGADKLAGRRRSLARLGTQMVFFLAVAAAIWGWSLRLPAPWPLPVLTGIATVLSAATLLLDRFRKMPEVAYGSLFTLAVAFHTGLFISNPWVMGLAGVLAFAACWLWHRAENSTEEVTGDSRDLIHRPSVAGWAFSAATAAAAWAAFQNTGWPVTTLTPWTAAAGAGLMGVALVTRSSRLAPCAALLPAAALVQLAREAEHLAFSSITIAAIALAGLALVTLPVARGNLDRREREISAVLVRLTAFFGISIFWWDFSPKFSGDGIALTAALLIAICWIRKTRSPIEILGFLTLATAWLIFESAIRPWSVTAELSWRGGGVCIGLLMLLGNYCSHPNPAVKAPSSAVAGGLACVVISLWATQMLVWRHDWTAVAVLWTLLGFASVTAGLWMRLRVVRQAGFALLALALVKVFAVDVWDFNAFMRVVSFMVLGCALILLGLFYNKFTDVLKRLIEEDKKV